MSILRTYAVTAFRSLRRHLGYTVLNVAGLSVGLAACLLIGLYVWHETTYDRFHEKSDRIARIVETRPTPSGTERVASTAAPVGPALVDEIPAVEEAARAVTLFRLTVEHGEKRRYVGDYLMTEPSFADVFDHPAARGNVRSALARPGAVVLTDEAARYYFGDADPMGQTLQVEGLGPSTVEAVLEPLPTRSHLQFSMLFPIATVTQEPGWFSTYMADWSPDWRLWSTYVVLDAAADRAQVNEQLTAFAQRHYETGGGPSAMTLQPVTDVHLYSGDISGGYNASPGHPTYVAIFWAIAVFILLIAVINYVNVATARASERAREVGVRKVMGAHRRELAVQFLMEAGALTFVALLAGIGLARAVWPAFQQVAGLDVSFGVLATPAAIAGVGVGTLLVALGAGLYPALVLTRFRPAEALRSRHTSVAGGAWVRRGLVGVQFALSIGLLVATFTVSKQLDFIQSKRLGFSENHLVAIDVNSSDVRANAETVKQEMERHPAVRSVTVSSRIPGDWKPFTQVEIRRPGNESGHAATFIAADASFLETFEISLTAGRSFDGARAGDSTAVLLNETAVRTLGLSDPVGATIQIPAEASGGGSGEEGAGGYTVRVVGVVEDVHVQSLHRSIEPLVIGWAGHPLDDVDYFTARVDGDRMEAAIDHLKAVGTQFDPSRPVEYHLLSDQIAAKYQADRRVQTLFGMASGLAVLIACVGLFGLAAFTMQQRRKEIGIRKALGATTASIVRLFSTQYVALVGGAFVVAAPVSYLLMQEWLHDFAYRASIGPGLVLSAGALALAVALLTVSVQALRAARTDPAHVLQRE